MPHRGTTLATCRVLEVALIAHQVFSTGEAPNPIHPAVASPACGDPERSGGGRTDHNDGGCCIVKRLKAIVYR
jgi:hypothetical protein